MPSVVSNCVSTESNLTKEMRWGFICTWMSEFLRGHMGPEFTEHLCLHYVPNSSYYLCSTDIPNYYSNSFLWFIFIMIMIHDQSSYLILLFEFVNQFFLFYQWFPKFFNWHYKPSTFFLRCIWTQIYAYM